MFPCSIAYFIPHSFSFICVHPTYLQFSISGSNSLKYCPKSFDSISVISNVENPGVSTIYEFSSISYNLTSVVVFYPRLFFSLITPS